MYTFPNIISTFRLISVIIFLILFSYNEIFLALVVLFISSISDILDGFLARVLKQKTKLGSFLDPLADKVLIITTFILLMIKKYIPWWFFSLVLAREVLVVSGWIISWQNVKTLEVKPRLLGKISIFLQMSTMVLVILNAYYKNNFIFLLISKLYIITSIFAFISLIDYIFYARRLYKLL